MKNTPLYSDVLEIIRQLNLVIKEQKTVEQAIIAFKDFCDYNKDNQDVIEFDVNKVTSTLQFQTLRFQSGLSFHGPPYVDTCLKIICAEDFGYYHFLTCLNGDIFDDLFDWGDPLVSQLPDKSYYEALPIEEVGPDFEADVVPPHMQPALLTLSEFARIQKLVEHASHACAKWFIEHPSWFRDYPRSFYEQPIGKHFGWLHNYPNSFQWVASFPLSENTRVQMSLEGQKVCFKHAIYPFPYLITILDIFAEEYMIGSYNYCTDLDGLVIEELSCILPYPLSY